MLRLFGWAVAAGVLLSGATSAAPPAERSGTTSVRVSVASGAAHDAWVAATAAADGPAALSPVPLKEPQRIPAAVGVPLLLCVGAADAATQCRTIVPDGDEKEAFTLDAGRRVQGQCFVGRNRAAGARVFVLLPRNQSRRPGTMPLARQGASLVMEVKADSTGQFEIAHLAPGEYVFEVHVKGGRQVQTDPIRVSNRRASEPPDAVVTVPDIRIDAGLALNVLVTDDAGTPVVKANVGALQKPGNDDLPRIVEDETDKDGKAVLLGLDPFLPVNVGCTAAGYARGSLPFDVPPVAATCVVSRFATLTGRVEDAERHQPILGAVVSLDRRHVASTDERGLVTVEHVVPGPHTLAVTAPGFSVWSDTLTAKPARSDDLGTITLRPGRQIGGRVIDAETKTPVPEALVTVDGPPGTASAMTDADGRFTITVPEEALRIGIAARDYAAARAEIPSGMPPPDIVVALGRSGTLVVAAWNDDGSGPCVGCSISAMGSGIADSDTSDAKGETRFSLPPGTYNVLRDRVRTGAAAVVVSSGGPSVLATVRARETTRVELGAPARTVRVTLDTPVDAAWRLVALSPSSVQTVTSDATGAFSVRIVANEAYAVRLEQSVVGVRLGTIPADYSDSQFSLHVGRTTVEMRLARNGEPASGETIVLADAAGGTLAWARSLADGTVTIPFLPAGSAGLRYGGRPLTSMVVPLEGVLKLGAIDIGR